MQASRSGSSALPAQFKKPLIAAAALGASVLVGFSAYALPAHFIQPAKSPAAQPASLTSAGPTAWVAAASGRIEPLAGEIRIGVGIMGRMAEALVRVNDKVEEGKLLIRLDDEEARARFSAAEAEAEARRRDRDAQPAIAGREDVRRAEDAIYSAERAVTNGRFELDYAMSAKRVPALNDTAVADARRHLADARDRLQRERLAYARAQGKFGIPAPNRLDSSLTAARADVTLAEAVLEKTRIRAPSAGTVLQLNAKVGETVAPAVDQPLLVMGDISSIRVKAEVDERDVAKVRIGQKAFVRCNAYPGREFEGKVVSMAPSLAAARITARGPRRPTDVEVLEVTLELDGSVPLLTGMRVDAFFRKPL